ncbi:hypothetical protein [Leptospira meyeri]|uniref:hypothetical protein n=1 Tax=Leptospira meyeri TaxID=29508 RepID=UPI000C2A7EAC|nr:hypothetical protein [Leptospira meyeri]PJZ79867.1 hypothetical protein CH359_15145 [Leptospira meyeri]PJZ96173.1 hypothetical protein CH358_14765 [Leptospira meyeri]
MKNNPVTVKELIQMLKDFPEDLPIFVSGYESGYDHFYKPEIIELVHRPDNMYFDGEYQIPEANEIPNISAVVFARVNRND